MSSKYCDKYISEYVLYNLIFKEIDDKINNTEKYNLKIKFKIIITRLNNIFYYFNIIKRDNILFISFTSDIINNINNIFDENIIYTEIQNNIQYLPSEEEIDNFMIDNFKINKIIEKYIKIKNYNNDTILHNIIRNKDLDRMKKILKKYNYMIYDVNDNDEIPIDLNKSIDISNYFNKIMLIKIKILENKFKTINEENYINNNKIINALLFFFFLLFGLYILFLYLILN